MPLLIMGVDSEAIYELLGTYLQPSVIGEGKWREYNEKYVIVLSRVK
jgi:hypothetical protein